ncbi:polysaccharide lyase [Chitinophaga sp. 30R24]|uniref:polysaccharide lyase n=1 Tax=Chitinophaga sp. 30R24 TaxID=3248838 RepID=UPI003B8FD1E2
MNSTVSFRTTVAVALLLISGSFTACKKNLSATLSPAGETGNAADAVVGINSINSTWSVNWDGYATGTTYTSGNAAADFGNVTGWNNSRAYISNGNLRIQLDPNALSAAGGVVANIDVSDGTAYEMDYDIRFHSQFDWSRGGKVGFGFSVGDGNTGGDPGWDGNGGSLRLMWYQNDAGRVYFQPYLYYKDQPGDYGDDFGLSYPASGSIQKGTTYHVHLYIKSNTGSNTDGHVQIVINGTVLLDRNIRWTTNDRKRQIREVTFHTFRGGSQSYWESSSVGYIYYDNLSVHKIN